jgi:4-hydroxy-2-oxoheptanedioate aldolase
MNWLHDRVQRGDVLAGVWLTFGSSAVAELAGLLGYDWALVDTEHGYTGAETLLPQLQGLAATPCASIVRVESHDPALYKRTLDLGPSGIMSPMVNTADEARAIVRAMRYPPEGIRGFTGAGRGPGYGLSLDEYTRRANRELLNIVQIETPGAVAQIDQIAAVEGVHVLFVGPSDLTLNMGIHTQYDHPDFQAALAKVNEAARRHGKRTGILVLRPEELPRYVEQGFTVIAHGIDSVAVRFGLAATLERFAPFRAQR